MDGSFRPSSSLLKECSVTKKRTELFGAIVAGHQSRQFPQPDAISSRQNDTPAIRWASRRPEGEARLHGGIGWNESRSRVDCRLKDCCDAHGLRLQEIPHGNNWLSYWF
jgi:hypothetical protein